jgi:hypothetical protein
MNNIMLIANLLISALRSFGSHLGSGVTTQGVIDAIKNAATEALTHTEWQDGEKTQFVINAAMAIAAVTPTPWDDFAVQALAFLYLKKYAKTPAVVTPPVVVTPPIPVLVVDPNTTEPFTDLNAATAKASTLNSTGTTKYGVGVNHLGQFFLYLMGDNIGVKGLTSVWTPAN